MKETFEHKLARVQADIGIKHNPDVELWEQPCLNIVAREFLNAGRLSEIPVLWNAWKFLDSDRIIVKRLGWNSDPFNCYCVCTRNTEEAARAAAKQILE